MNRSDKPSEPMILLRPIVGDLSAPFRRHRAGIKRRRVWLEWSGSSSSTNPKANVAFLYLNFGDGSQQMLRCTPAQLDALAREVAQCQSWMNGNDYAGMRKREPCPSCCGAPLRCQTCGDTGVAR